jgi:beta-RFAP synthase
MIFTTSSRIHINSIKMNTYGGWGGGGIGFSLKDPKLRIDFFKSNNVEIECSNKTLKLLIEKYATKFIKKYKVPGCKIRVLEFFEPHYGLGSETQSALLIGEAFKKTYNLSINNEEIAKFFEVGGVSGIGYYSFLKRGFIIEGGYPMSQKDEKKDFNIHSSKPPVLISRYNFPNNMYILLIIPNESAVESFSRVEENKLFKENTPISSEEVGNISTAILTGLIPGIIIKDYNQIVKNIMFISTLGTKKIELEINFNLIKDIQDKLEDLLEFKYSRKKRANFSLINNENQNISNFILKNKEISIKKPIPWLGLSSLGSTLYSILNISSNKELNQLKSEISKRIKNCKVIITKVENGEN